jgi:hypothetical protein
MGCPHCGGASRVDTELRDERRDAAVVAKTRLNPRADGPAGVTPARLVPVRASFSGRHLEHENEDEDMMRAYEVLD